MAKAVEPRKKIYTAVSEIATALAEIGLGKGSRNQNQGWAFRGIDDIYNVVGPLLARYKVRILPRVQHRETIQREIRNNVWMHTYLEVDYIVVSMEDGSTLLLEGIPGEAMDNGDKSCGKAMSYAYKQAVIQLFSIPTEGDNDPDSTTPPQQTAAEAKRVPKEPAKASRAKKASPKSDEGAAKERTALWADIDVAKDAGDDVKLRQLAGKFAKMEMDPEKRKDFAQHLLDARAITAQEEDLEKMNKHFVDKGWI